MSSRQDRFMVDDINRSRVRDTLPAKDQAQLRRVNADLRLAEYADTARLLVRERHGMTTKAEQAYLDRLRSTIIRLSELVEAGML